MNISRDAVPPDLPVNFWQSLVLQTCTTPASYTTCPEWNSDGESMWMRLSKFSLFDRLTLHALAALIAPGSVRLGAQYRFLTALRKCWQIDAGLWR